MNEVEVVGVGKFSGVDAVEAVGINALAFVCSKALVQTSDCRVHVFPAGGKVCVTVDLIDSNMTVTSVAENLKGGSGA